MDHQAAWVHPISTPKVIGKEPEVLLYDVVVGISVRGSGRGSGWREREVEGGAILREANRSCTFDKLKFQINLISEQYLPLHREVETGCWYPMALGRRRSSGGGAAI